MNVQGHNEVRWRTLLNVIGPGILFAGSAIGGSHLVQSTRAGALYGFKLLLIILLVNVFKYPFFQFTYRYTAATGESVLKGYRRLGKWALVVFFLVSFITSGINSAGVLLVTAGLAGFFFNITFHPFIISAGLLLIILMILLYGHYGWLDKIMKIMVVVLSISTTIAFTAAFHKGPQAAPGYTPEILWSYAGISFLIALMGWMPAPIEVSVWSSLWSLERSKQTGHHPTVKEALCDFNIGYIGTTVMALLFLSLGALIMYGTGSSFSNSPTEFSAQLTALYTRSLGEWSLVVISSAALLAMFSTTLTAIDAYPRTLNNALIILSPRLEPYGKQLGILWTLFVSAVVLFIIGFLTHGLKTLIDTATVTSFLAAPVIAVINYKVVTSDHMPAHARPSYGLAILSRLGIVYLIGFSLLYCFTVIGH